MTPDVTLDNQNDQGPAYPAEASREMIDAGIFYGRKKSKTNPKMREFILMNRGGIEIINLQKTVEMLDKAVEFVKEKASKGALILLVGIDPAANASIERIAKRFGYPFVTTRWVGGAITNFPIISKRIEYMKKLRADFASGALEKYTKKERVELEKELERLEDHMGGLEFLLREPDLVIMIDPGLHHTALREARHKKIPVIALANVDTDPDHIDYMVPGNDKARRSIEWFLEKIEKGIEEGTKLRAATPETTAEKPAEKPAAE